MRKTIWSTVLLAAAATLFALLWGNGNFYLGLWIGAFWGLANFWCLIQAARALLQGARWSRLLGWAAIKFVGLYGLIAWLLVARHLSPVGWLTGFTVSLIGLSIGAFPSLRPILQKVTPVIAFVFLNFWTRAAQAVEEAAHPPEIPNFITLLMQGHHGAFVHFLHTWENAIFAFIIVGIVGVVIACATRKLTLMPGRGQVALEMIVEGLDNMVCGVLGQKEGRRYLPFLGTLFLFILSMNLAGLVPGLKSPTSRFEMTGAIALCVFVFVQWTGIRRMGFVGYLDHMIGQPRDLVGWILSPLMFFIHGIGELVKPLSLALRLFGNIMGEDTLLGVFVMLGALTMAWSHIPIGIPFHLPFVLLAIIFSIVQALVFTSLSMIYIYMMLPHDSEIMNGAASDSRSRKEH